MQKSKSANQRTDKKALREAALIKGPTYFQYEDYEIKPRQVDRIVSDLAERYQIVDKVGRGKYSDVYKAVRLGQTSSLDKLSVLKILKPVRIAKIRRQIKILSSLSHPSIINLQAVLFDSCCKNYTLAFDYVNVSTVNQSVPFSDKQIRFYLARMLQGLNHCHSRGVMHRDIKPQNVLIDRDKKEIKIIDWGLADFYLPKKEYNVRVASRYYKGPELLLNYNYYDYSLDMWSVGCWLASMIFRKSVFFQGNDNIDQLFKIGQILGSDDIRKYVKKYTLKPDVQIQKWLSKQDFPKVPFLSFQNKQNMAIANDQAIDLLQKLLTIDHNDRPTAAQALIHPYLRQATL